LQDPAIIYTRIFFLFQLFHLFPNKKKYYRQGDDGSIGPIGGSGIAPAIPGNRVHEAVSHTCLSSSAEYELALILKELRVITDQVSGCHLHNIFFCHILFH
jgi:hypothetical protein